MTGPNLNDIQKQILACALLLKKKQKLDEDERQYELSLMIHRPEWYKEYKERKEAEEFKKEQEEIKWSVPGSVGELREVLGMIEQHNKNLDSQKSEFAGIDISLLGDNDG